jgi:hypothetical protein
MDLPGESPLLWNLFSLYVLLSFIPPAVTLVFLQQMLLVPRFRGLIPASCDSAFLAMAGPYGAGREPKQQLKPAL